jgi:hypothetical protein
MMDPNFYRTELYERERRMDEMRQAQQARLVRQAQAGKKVDTSITRLPHLGIRDALGLSLWWLSKALRQLIHIHST